MSLITEVELLVIFKVIVPGVQSPPVGCTPIARLPPPTSKPYNPPVETPPLLVPLAWSPEVLATPKFLEPSLNPVVAQEEKEK